MLLGVGCKFVCLPSQWIEGCWRGQGCPLRRSIWLAYVCRPASTTTLSLSLFLILSSACYSDRILCEPSTVFKVQPQGCGLALVPVGNKNSWFLCVCVLPSHNPSVFPQCSCSMYLFDCDFYASVQRWSWWWEACVALFFCMVMSEAGMAHWLCACACRSSDSEMNGKAGGRGPPNKASETNSNGNNLSMVSETPSDTPSHARVSTVAVWDELISSKRHSKKGKKRH